MKFDQEIGASTEDGGVAIHRDHVRANDLLTVQKIRSAVNDYRGVLLQAQGLRQMCLGQDQLGRNDRSRVERAKGAAPGHQIKGRHDENLPLRRAIELSKCGSSPTLNSAASCSA